MIRTSERILESILFGSRWLLAPFFLGLVAAIALLLVKFAKQLLTLATTLPTLEEHGIVVGVLNLVDVTLMANLLVIIILAGYESSVSRLDTAAHESRLSWMGSMGFNDLKLKVIGSTVAILAVELLSQFLSMGEADIPLLKWKLVTYLALVVSGVLFAAMDRLASGGEGGH